jgi:hypothetical protein
MCDLALWLFLIIAICSVQQGELSPCYRTILYAFARFLRDVGAVGLLWRCSVRMTPIRAIIVGPPLSADQHQRMGLAKPAAIVAATAELHDPW